MKNILLLFLAGCFTMGACKKTGNGTSGDTLPPITQTGANTFGCLINGKVYVPKGFDQNHPNFDMIVDPGNNNNLDIRTFSKNNGIESHLNFASFNINSSGIYIIGSTPIYPTYMYDINSNVCYFVSSNNNFKSGYLKINTYNLTNQIISGEFEFKLYDPTISCDTIRITQGRFDKKL